MEYYVDLHCHPTLKPVGLVLSDLNANLPNHKSSIWYNEPLRFINKLLDVVFTVTTYSQSNFKTCADGKVQVVHVSLHSPEVKFFINKLGSGSITTGLENYVTGFSSSRIKEIEAPSYDYFYDLTGQYQFLEFMNDKEVEIKGQKYRYVLIDDPKKIDETLAKPGVLTLAILLNIEGGHCLGCGKDPIRHPIDREVVMDNIDKVLKWKYKPLYLTLSHHFYNELAGHAKSLPDSIKKWIDQSYKMGTGITPLGYDVIKKCLEDQDKRILIDIKHLSIKSRKEYYKLLEEEYQNEIPIIYSHGGVNGLKSFADAGQTSSSSPFNQGNISIFDEEIVRIANTKGIIGLNIDQRVMASSNEIKKIRWKIHRYYYLWSKLIWNNIKHIAHVLDAEGLSAWDHICMGTDYDGAINPINGFWSEERMPLFKKELTRHISKFLKYTTLNPINQLDAEEIAQKIMRKNAMDFLVKNY